MMGKSVVALTFVGLRSVCQGLTQEDLRTGSLSGVHEGLHVQHMNGTLNSDNTVRIILTILSEFSHLEREKKVVPRMNDLHPPTCNVDLSEH